MDKTNNGWRTMTVNQQNGRTETVVKRITVTLAVMVALLGLTGVRSEASWNACDWGRFCMWEHTNYWGVFDQVLYPTGQCVNSPQPNGTSSIRNNRPLNTYIYEFANCGGQAWLVNSGQSYSPVPSPLHDRVRSFFMVE